LHRFLLLPENELCVGFEFEGVFATRAAKGRRRTLYDLVRDFVSSPAFWAVNQHRASFGARLETAKRARNSV
jgi:hypothetical protein